MRTKWKHSNGKMNTHTQIGKCMFFSLTCFFFFYSHTMSAITAMVRTNMAAMAHVFLAQRVRSIHMEKDTNFLENICDKQTIN